MSTSSAQICQRRLHITRARSLNYRTCTLCPHCSSVERLTQGRVFARRKCPYSGKCKIVAGLRSLNCADPGPASNFHLARPRPRGSASFCAPDPMVTTRQSGR
eukprot:11353912-Alexandrium_andersonii.AAC.1